MPVPPVALPETHVHTLRSHHVDQEFQLWIAEPMAGARPMPDGPHQVLYVLDANLFFGTAVEMTRLMHQLFAELPPLVVVGVAYPSSDLKVHGELRNRDFTPTSDALYDELASRIPDWKPLLPVDQRMGRAHEFLRFLRDEVRPLVEEKYDVTHDGSAIFGSSLGGLFVTYALLAAPESFDRYIAASPALWWDGEHLFGLEEHLAQRVDDVNARVFLGVGGLEEAEDVPWAARFQMVTHLRRMAETLRGRGYASLQLDDHVFADETHTSVVPAALTRGLRAVFARR